MHYLDRLLDERTSLTGVMTGLRDRAAGEDRDLTDGERSEISRLQERCVVVDGLLTEHEAQTSSARAFAQLQDRIEAGRETTSRPAARGGPGRTETRSAGDLVVTSPQFESYPGRGAMSAVEIPDYLPLERRAVVTTADLAIAPFIWSNEPPTPASPLIDAVSVVRVSSGVVEWVVTGPDPVAAAVPEGTAKPEAAITFTPATATLETLAHWIQITRQALSDAAYMRSLIETKLRRGLMRKVEADLVALLNAATLQAAGGADLSAAIRNGIGMVEGAGYSPNAVALNPADFAALDVANAVAAQSGAVRTNSYWGLRPIAAPGLTAGTAIVGDFKDGVVLFDRGVSDVFVTDSHGALFISNILVILAEGRYRSAITDPLALAEATATVIP